MFSTYVFPPKSHAVGKALFDYELPGWSWPSLIFKSLHSFRIKLILVEETFALPSNQLGSTTSYASMLKVTHLRRLHRDFYTPGSMILGQCVFVALDRAVKIMTLTVNQWILAVRRDLSRQAWYFLTTIFDVLWKFNRSKCQYPTNQKC